MQMMFFRTLLLVCPAACLLAQTPPPAAAKPAPVIPPDKIVISVGDLKMTAAQFDEIVDALPPQYQGQARGPGRKQFVENLVRIMVLSQEGRRRHLDQSPRYKIQSQFQSDNLLAGVTFEAMNKEVKIDDAEMQKYYAEHKQDYEMANARHILIRMQGSPVPVRPGQKELSDGEALAKAQDLRKKLEGGADFAALATAESDDVGSGAKGGDLGSFAHHQMVPAFDEVVFKMKPGELSEPVKTQFGYHLIKLESIQSKTFEQAKPEIEKHFQPDLAKKNMDELEKKSNVVVDPQFLEIPK